MSNIAEPRRARCDIRRTRRVGSLSQTGARAQVAANRTGSALIAAGVALPHVSGTPRALSCKRFQACGRSENQDTHPFPLGHRPVRDVLRANRAADREITGQLEALSASNASASLVSARAAADRRGVFAPCGLARHWVAKGATQAATDCRRRQLFVALVGFVA